MLMSEPALCIGASRRRAHMGDWSEPPMCALSAKDDQPAEALSSAIDDRDAKRGGGECSLHAKPLQQGGVLLHEALVRKALRRAARRAFAQLAQEVRRSCASFERGDERVLVARRHDESGLALDDRLARAVLVTDDDRHPTCC